MLEIALARSRLRPLYIVLALLLFAGIVLAGLLLGGTVWLPGAAAPPAPAIVDRTAAAEAVGFANRFLRLDGPDAFEHHMRLASTSLRGLYAQADARDHRPAPPDPDAADPNPAFVPPSADKPAMAERSVWIFGLIDAWHPGAVHLRHADAAHAAVDVELRVDGEPATVVPARLLLVREDGGWRLDDVLHGPDGVDGSLRGYLHEVR